MAEQDREIIFSNLSEKIRDWLASVQLTFIIIDINRRLGLPFEKQIIIPRMIWHLVTGELAPQNFVSELGVKLGISTEIARTLTQEIEQKVLRPVSISLKSELGIDVNLIYTTSPTSPIPPKPPIVPPTSPRPMPPAQPLGEARSTVERPMVPLIIKVPINITESKPPLPPIQQKPDNKDI